MAMTEEKVLFSVKQLEEAFKTVKVLSPVIVAQNASATTAETQIGHLLWMCHTIPLFLAEGRREKAMRWLGFLQGSAWALRLRSIESMKRDNAPEDSDL
jgi:hypothetical protein